MSATATYSFGTAAEMQAELSALEGTEVELTLERPTQQKILNEERDDETVITYVDRSETFIGLLWGLHVAASCVHANIGTRKVFIRGHNPICAAQGYVIRQSRTAG